MTNLAIDSIISHIDVTSTLLMPFRVFPFQLSQYVGQEIIPTNIAFVYPDLFRQPPKMILVRVSRLAMTAVSNDLHR